MQVVEPREAFPEPGTVLSPVVFYDGDSAFVCYEAAPAVGGGNVVLKFGCVIDLRVTPMNVRGIGACRYPIQPWAFNEIAEVEETAKWRSLNPRLWLISFNDETLEVLFGTVSLVIREARDRSLQKTLMGVLQ